MSKRPSSNEDDEEPKDYPPFIKLNAFGEHKRAISSVAFAPGHLTRDLDVCASASADGTAKLWDVPDQSTTESLPEDTDVVLAPIHTLIGHSRGINHITWSHTTGHLATASDDKTCRLWDAETGDALVEFRGHSNFCFCVKFNPTSNLLVSGSFDETVKLWDVRTGDCVTTLPAHSDPVTSVDINRDGTCIVSGSHDGLIRIWDTATGECLKTIYAPNNPPVSHVQYSPNGKYVLAGTLDSKLRLWSAPSKMGHCCKTFASDYVVNTKYCIASDFLCTRPERPACVVTGSETGQVVIYELNSRKVHQNLDGGHAGDAVLAVTTHDSRELIASGGMTEDRSVRFWIPDPKFDEVREMQEETQDYKRNRH